MNKKGEFKETNYADVIYNLRIEYGLTQKQLADLIAVSDRTISKWERGLTNPDIVCIERLCYELDVSADLIISSKPKLKDKINKFKRNTIKYIKKYYRRILIIIIYIIFMLKFIFLMQYNTNNTINIYNILYTSDDLSINKGYILNTSEYNLIIINDIVLQDSNYDTIDIELYTYIDNNKYILYTSQELEDIYIEQTFNEYIIDAIKKGIYLNISTTYKNKKYEYECNLKLDNIYTSA